MTVFLQKWISQLEDRQRDILLGLAIVLGVAVVYYFQWLLYLTGVEGSRITVHQPGGDFWWANDSVNYRAAGEWIFGRDHNTAIGSRPWLYPFLIGLARTIFGAGAEHAMWILQFLMWLGSGTFIYLALQNASRSTVLAMIGAGFFFSHPSPLILTFHGMTETLNIFLISAYCRVLASDSRNRLDWAVLIMALCTVTKPIYLVFLILLIVYFVIKNNRLKSKLKTAGSLTLLLIPIWLQLILSLSVIGKPTISSIGGYTFKNYLVADVYLRTEGTEWRETMALIEDWDLRQQLDYLRNHKTTTLITLRSHLIDANLWTGSLFTRGEDNRMDGFAITMNAFAVYLHLLMLPFVIYYFLSGPYAPNKTTIALLYSCFVVQWLTSGISTGQEDRLLVTALPLWITAYLLVIWGLMKTRSQP
jgi:hypothetical protein